jgi:lambda repressor-like predicted transcriptional regulator
MGGTKSKGSKPKPNAPAVETAPRGERRIDDAWRAWAHEQMERWGITLTDLAERAGISKSSLSDALSPRRQQPTFRYADAVEKIIRHRATEAGGEADPAPAPPVGPPPEPPPPPARRRRTIPPTRARGSPETTLRERMSEAEIRELGLSLIKAMAIEELEAFIGEATRRIARRG